MVFQDFPPMKPSLLADHSMKLTSSQNALSAAVNHALYNAQEISNLYAPVQVVGAQGHYYILQRYSSGGPFVRGGAVAGAELRLAASQTSCTGELLSRDEPEVVIVADVPPNANDYLYQKS